MRVLIIGAGVAGLTAAAALADRGARVTVAERRPAPAQACSRANGGQLSYSHGEPWSEPGIGLTALRYLLTPGAPLSIRSPFAEGFPRWACAFLAASRPETFARTRDILTDLAQASRAALGRRLAQEGDPEGLAFGLSRAGLRHVARNVAQLNILLAHARAKPSLRYTVEQGDDLPPELRHYACGAVFYPEDETGDIRLFCEWLAAKLRESGRATFLFNTRAERLLTERGRARGLLGADGELQGEEYDAFVIACGAEARPLTGLPLYPLKGYSVTYTLPADHAETPPAYSITDAFRKVVFSRLSGGRLRFAGMADIDGFNETQRSSRAAALRRLAAALIPLTRDLPPSDSWACLRPFLPDSLPAVGRLPGTENVFAHTGHGSLGWTLSSATADLLADAVMHGRERSELSPARFSR